MQYSNSKKFWYWVVLASIILMITMGIRQTIGLFILPIVDSINITISEISMSLAIGQLMWGAFQPIFGIWADKKGAFFPLITGAILIAIGQLGTIWASSFTTLTLTLGFLSPIGAAAGSFSLLIGIVATKIPEDKRSVASGLTNAGGSLGQFIFAPIVQQLIYSYGYITGLVFLSISSLATVLPSWLICRGEERTSIPQQDVSPPDFSKNSQLKKHLYDAIRNKSYLLLHAGFFTCGFHVAFLTTHLPWEISLCGHNASVSAVSLSLIGLCNIAGSIFAGILGKYFRMKFILSFFYAFRAIMIAIYLVSPKTEINFYIFAITTGFTWLATVPPTAGIVGKLFGTKYLATLFGLTLFTHQIGAFLGAWLGGLSIEYSGNLLWVWYIDIVLALLAAIINLPIKEQKIKLL